MLKTTNWKKGVKSNPETSYVLNICQTMESVVHGSVCRVRDNDFIE
jgi:hypothetical protein